MIDNGRQLAVSIWIIDLSDDAWRTETIPDLLDANEQARAARFKFQTHRNRFTRRRMAYRSILGQACGCDPARIAFILGQNGRPALSEPDPHLSFNTSHSDDIATIALTERAPIGIDLELMRPEIVEPSLLAQVLSKAEQRAFARLAPAEVAPTFFTAWTRKEAFVKAIGIGLSLAVDQIDVEPTRASPLCHRGPDGMQWSLIDIAVDPRYKSAIATPAAVVTASIGVWNRQSAIGRS